MLSHLLLIDPTAHYCGLYSITHAARLALVMLFHILYLSLLCSSNPIKNLAPRCISLRSLTTLQPLLAHIFYITEAAILAFIFL